jgi:hypothetical protein
MTENGTVAVRTYVPEAQRDRWRDHADRMGMSQSEFVRTMVQAGRRGFDLSTPEEEGSPDATPGGDGLEERVLAAVERGGPLGWDGLVEALAGDLEDRLEETLDGLQRRNEVVYSGREGGYVVADGD